MKNIFQKLLSVKLFAICYLPYLAVNMVTVINILDFTRVFLAIFAAWGFAICVNTYLFGGKKAWTDKLIALLIGFLAICLATQVINLSYGGVREIGQLCYFALCILVLYSQYRQNTADYKQSMGIIARVLGVVIGVLMAVSDWMFIDIFMGTVTGRNGVTIKVGFAENRLYGIFSSPNVGGFYALILIWCSVIVLLWVKDMKLKALWRSLSVIQILLAVMYISVALSRGTYVSGIVMLVSYLIIRAPFEKERNLKIWQQAAIRVASLVVAVVLSVVCVNVVNSVSCIAMRANFERKLAAGEIENADEILGIINNAELGSDGRVESGREDIDITNKRSAIWKTNLSLLEGGKLFTGVNEPHIYLEKMQAEGKSFTDQQVTFINYAMGNLHNGYLQIIVHCGIIAFIPMLVWLLWCAFIVGKRLFAACKGRFDTQSTAYAVFSLALVMVLAVLSNNVFETNFVLMGANFIQAVFWFAAGACVTAIKEGESAK